MNGHPARAVLTFWLLIAASAPASSQPPDEWFTRPILPETTRRSQMYAYVNANIPPLPRSRTLEEWTAYRSRLKPEILRLIGIDDILERHRLKVERRGVLERDGYTIEKVAYESYPGMHVPALVWVPAALKGKAPAAVSISGHSYCDSKAAGYVQARNYNLVRRGFIVVSYDYFGCNERSRFDPCQPGVSGATDHIHSLYSYTGRTPTGIEVLDGIRAVDYLYSRPDVDRARIAFTGESGGGNSTYWVSALDERVTLSVPVSASGAFAQWIKVDDNFDWHQRPPGLRAIADIGTFYALTAPRPLLVVNGHPELVGFALPDALRSVDYARDVYGLLGRTDAIAFRESTTGHGYQPDKREQLYAWLDRWFFDGKMPLGDRDLPYQPESKEALRVGMPAGSLSIPDLARRWVDETDSAVPLPDSPEASLAWRRDRLARLAPLLARRDPSRSPGVIYNYNYQSTSGPYKVERLQFEVDPDLIVPAAFVRREGRSKYKTVLLLDKKRGASDEAHRLLEQGYALLCLDPRGTGEVEWGGDRTTSWAEFVARPPVGMWAEDISKVTTYLLGRPDVEKVAVLGHGVFGKAALYAAALDGRIAAAAVTLDTSTYRREATSGLAHVFADVPRILTWGDTPQLAALVAPRPLAILAAGVPVSHNDERAAYFAPSPRFEEAKTTVPDEALRKDYEWSEGFYRGMGAESSLKIGIRDQKRGDAAVRWLSEHF